MKRRVVLMVLLLLGADAPKIVPKEYSGKVVPLASVVEKSGARLDPDAVASSMAFQCDDGKLYLLIKDDGARMFFKDARLLNRPMRLTARLLPDAPLLHVVQVHSLPKGEPHEVYYWCDICVIRRNEKMMCECCGAAMELRESPVKK